VALVNLSAEMPGWVRFKPAADWLAAHRNQAVSANSDSALKPAFDKFLQDYFASTGRKTLSTKEREVLFAKFEKYIADSKAQASR